jgi:hypothetical protein
MRKYGTEDSECQDELHRFCMFFWGLRRTYTLLWFVEIAPTSRRLKIESSFDFYYPGTQGICVFDFYYLCVQPFVSRGGGASDVQGAVSRAPGRGTRSTALSCPYLAGWPGHAGQRHYPGLVVAFFMALFPHKKTPPSRPALRSKHPDPPRTGIQWRRKPALRKGGRTTSTQHLPLGHAGAYLSSTQLS